MWHLILKSCNILLWAITSLSGVIIFTLSANSDLREFFWDTFLQKINYNSNLLIQSFAALLIIIVLIGLWAKIRLSRNSSRLVYNTAEGQIIIEASSISRFILEILKNFDGVRHSFVYTKKDARKVNVSARVQVTDEQPVAALVADLQLTIRQRMRKAFGLDLLRDIKIEVTRVVSPQHNFRRLLSIHRPTIEHSIEEEKTNPEEPTP